jgi:signal transduction histidine kinase
MNPDWFELKVSVVASVAEFILCVAVLGYLLSLPAKNLESKLFASFILAGCLFFAIEIFHNQVVYSPFRWVSTALSNSIVGIMQLIFVWFAYQCGGNSYKRESYVSFLFLGLLVWVPYVIFDIGARNIFAGLGHLIGVLWIAGVYGRKASRAEYEAGHPTPTSKMLKGFQKWAFINSLIWAVALYNPLAMLMGFPAFSLWYYVIHPLNFIQITYATIVFLNYTPQRTSFQAKIVGLVLCPLLIILALTPFLLRSLIVDLPNFSLVNHQIVVAFLILIPLTTLAVIVSLPRFLRSNLLSPLNHILEGVRQVEGGDLTVQVPVSVNDEVGMLARQFNIMTVSLHRYSNQMEALVVERTTQLQYSLDTLQATQAQLIQKEKMASLGELTAGIAHEIQNPLNFVNNFAEVSAEMAEELRANLHKGDIPNATVLSAELQENMGYITENGKRASSIVRAMLEHSRSSYDERRPTSLNELADEYLRLAYHGMRAQNPDFQVELHTAFDRELPLLEVAPQEIGRVLLNLYNNAFYAVREKQGQQVVKAVMSDEAPYQPIVWESTRQENGQVILSVKDNGVGIPDSIREKIFQPFFTTKPTGEGTGLGLSLSYDIITKGHGGEIQIESQEGEGSEFIILLPPILT